MPIRPNNIKIMLEADAIAWDNLIEALERVASKEVSISDIKGGQRKMAATHFRRKIKNTLAKDARGNNVILTMEDMKESYLDSFTA